MTNTFKITINDIIKRGTFKSATVLAGDKGLNNQVKWSHILETNQLDSIIDGGELILTTASELKLDTSEGIIFLNNLIAKDAAGICIELGTHINSISKEVIDLADHHQFPIIVFDHFVKFIDITQDLHSLILHKHHHLLEILNELSMSFSELALLPNGILKILEKLFSYTKGMTLYITNEQNSSYYPPNTKTFKERIHKYIMDLEKKSENRFLFSLDNKKFVFVRVKGSGITWGYLCLQLKENSLENMIFPVLEQAALAIAQIMLRNRTQEERKQNAEDKLVRDLLYGRNSNFNELKEHIPILEKSFSFRLILMQKNQKMFQGEKDNVNETNLQRTILLRFILNENGFSSVMSIGNNEIAIIAFFNNNNNIKRISTNPFLQVVDTIKQTQEENIIEGRNYLIGISSQKQDLLDIIKCYQEAKKSLFLKKSNIKASIFYEKIGIYRLLLNQSQETLESYISDFLQPLIDYDKKKGSELVKTLEVYLECLNAKKETSEKLFIVRQTLYHRLNKIEELLGENYLDSHNRIAIESAIKAKHIITFNKQ